MAWDRSEPEPRRAAKKNIIYHIDVMFYPLISEHNVGIETERRKIRSPSEANCFCSFAFRCSGVRACVLEPVYCGYTQKVTHLHRINCRKKAHAKKKCATHSKRMNKWNWLRRMVRRCASGVCGVCIQVKTWMIKIVGYKFKRLCEISLIYFLRIVIYVEKVFSTCKNETVRPFASDFQRAISLLEFYLLKSCK